MRGENDIQSGMFSYFSPEQRVPAQHPLRAIKAHADAALLELSPIFDSMYSKMGRPSIPPERLLKSQLLIALYSVRSETYFCEQVDYSILFRWFLDMSLEEPSFDPTTFTKNRDRLLEHRVALKFFDRVVNIARKEGLLSDDHFTVDGTLIEACARLKSFRPKGEDPSDRPTTDDDPGNPSVHFRGEKRLNKTHVSTTDPESRLVKKSAGKEAKLSFGAHALMENRNGFLIDITVTEATGDAEREAAKEMLTRQARKRVKPKTLGADKTYDTSDVVKAMRKRKTTPHVAANTERRGGSAIDGRTIRREGHIISQRIRKRVEEIFGWFKTIGGFRRTRYKGRDRTHLQAWFVGAAYNLLRIVNIQSRTAAVA